MQLASSREPEDPAGLGNDDHEQYIRRDGDEWVMMEAEGPGVITRLWFTGREGASRDQSYLDHTVMHLYIDDAEVPFVEGRRGILLGELVSGTHPAFPVAWVADRARANGALISYVPIPFAGRVRITVNEPPGKDASFFYQIDWRDFDGARPGALELTSFTGALSEEAESALTEAARLWATDEDLCSTTSTRRIALTPGVEGELTLTGPTVLRSLTIAAGSLQALRSLSVTIEVDGVSVANTPLSRFLFALDPTQPGLSAMSNLYADGRAELRYPLPIREEMRIRLHAEGEDPMSIEATLCHDPGPVPDDLGSLRASCGVTVSDALGTNLVLLAAEGHGHYAGQFLVTEGPHVNFVFLEGDHEVVVDGNYEILGTGTEDYFGGAFYYQLGSSALLLNGWSGRASDADSGTSVVSQYRHHILDTVPFQNTFAFEFENYLGATRWEYCLFWYQFDGPPPP